MLHGIRNYTVYEEKRERKSMIRLVVGFFVALGAVGTLEDFFG